MSQFKKILRSIQKVLTTITSILGVFFVITVLLAIDAFEIEPYWIQTTRYEVPANVRSPLTIMHLTDLHTHGMFDREKKIVKLMNENHPDLIVITGDVVTTSGTLKGYEDVLRSLHAPLGVWMVRGNWENYFLTARDEKEILAAAPELRILHNSSARIRDDIWLLGVEDIITGRPDLISALRNIPRDAYKIALFHAPAYFDSVQGSVDLALAGHTHGGQVYIPFIQPTWLPAGTSHYLSGWFQLGDTKMYVSRGVGTSAVPVRFLCRPEVDFIKLVPKK